MQLMSRASLLLVLLAGCATSRPYDPVISSHSTWVVSTPGRYGATPMMRSVAWTWQHPAVTDPREFQRDSEICNASSRTNVATMMFGGAPPIRLYEDCMERLGYRLVGKRASGDPVSRGWGR
jgi:hypothetical protein